MTLQPGENLLRLERIHPAIFVMPVLAAISLLILMLPEWFFLRLMTGMFPGSSTSWLSLMIFWPLLIVVVPLFLITLFAYLKSEITLTNKRLLYRTGLVARAFNSCSNRPISTKQKLENILQRRKLMLPTL